jgi:hypothetical protein
MHSENEEAWRQRIEWKIDRLAHHVNCLSLAVSSRTPLLPSLPPPRRRSTLWPIVIRLLMSYLLPALGTLLLLARHMLARLWEALSAAL